MLTRASCNGQNPCSGELQLERQVKAKAETRLAKLRRDVRNLIRGPLERLEVNSRGGGVKIVTLGLDCMKDSAAARTSYNLTSFVQLAWAKSKRRNCLPAETGCSAGAMYPILEEHHNRCMECLKRKQESQVKINQGS
jgi:hypothetical protein